MDKIPFNPEPIKELKKRGKTALMQLFTINHLGMLVPTPHPSLRTENIFDVEEGIRLTLFNFDLGRVKGMNVTITPEREVIEPIFKKLDKNLLRVVSYFQELAFPIVCEILECDIQVAAPPLVDGNGFHYHLESEEEYDSTKPIALSCRYN